MQSIASTNYKVDFLSGTFSALNRFLKKQRYSSYFIICDENTLQFCLPRLILNCKMLAKAEIIEIESGETSKSLNVTALVCETLIEQNANRHSLIINLGGGVVSDLGGFCAAIYKRGIDFINLPTSLLAMADASIGGKTGIDFVGVKNALGSFHQPKAVFICVEFLLTLPQRHFMNGLAEIYKIALISDAKLWNQVSKLSAELLIHKSLTLKNKLVLKDPFDKGVRQQLNFGHTIGHAIEASFLQKGFNILHGEAIVAGMIIESHLALQKKMLQPKVLSEITKTLLLTFGKLPNALANEDLLPFLANDKKNTAKGLQFALITKIGGCKTGISCTTVQIKKSLVYYRQQHA